MKILMASSSSGSRGGGELYLLYLGRALTQRGHTVVLWASDHSRMDELANSFSGIGEVIRSPYRNTYDLRGRSISSYLNLRGVGHLARIWRKSQPDLLHVNKQNLEDGLDLLHAARRSHLPNICTIHLTQSAGYLKARLAPARDFVARRALRNYHNPLVTVLENRRQDLASFIGNSARVHMIPNGVPLYDLARRSVVRNARRGRAGFGPGRPGLHRGRPHGAPETPARISRAGRRHPRTLSASQVSGGWGDGALSESWDAWVAANHLGKVIRRFPWRNDVPSLLMAADVFLHVAEFEGPPLATPRQVAGDVGRIALCNLLAPLGRNAFSRRT